MVTLKMQGRAKRVSSVGSQKDGPEKTIKTRTDEGKGSDGQGELLLLRLQKKPKHLFAIHVRREE